MTGPHDRVGPSPHSASAWEATRFDRRSKSNVADASMQGSMDGPRDPDPTSISPPYWLLDDLPISPVVCPIICLQESVAHRCTELMPFERAMAELSLHGRRGESAMRYSSGRWTDSGSIQMVRHGSSSGRWWPPKRRICSVLMGVRTRVSRAIARQSAAGIPAESGTPLRIDACPQSRSHREGGSAGVHDQAVTNHGGARRCCLTSIGCG